MEDYCQLLHAVLSRCTSDLFRREAAERSLCMAAGLEVEAAEVQQCYEARRLQETAVLRRMVSNELLSYADTIDRCDDRARAELLAAVRGRIESESVRFVHEQVAGLSGTE